MTITAQLGYPDDSLEPVLDTLRANRAGSVMTQLDAIDNALAVASLDSMAIALGDTKVDYAQHVAMLKAEGSRLLKYLARLGTTDPEAPLVVYFDRYSGTSHEKNQGTSGSSPWSIQSYW